MASDEASKLKVDLSKLETLHGYNHDGNILLVGSRRTGVEILVVWFPVVVAILYSLIWPFMYTDWAMINLIAIVQIFGLFWVLLVVFTWAQGATRHFYQWDVARRSITHMNTDETKPMDLRVKLDDNGVPNLELSDPLASGWHLETPPDLMVAANVEQCDDIAEWQPGGFFSRLRPSAMKEDLTGIFLVANIFLIPVCLVNGAWMHFLWAQVFYLVAWATGELVGWSLDRREYNRFTVGELAL